MTQFFFKKNSSDDFGSACIQYWCEIEPLLESFVVLIERNEIDIVVGLRYFLKNSLLISDLHESGFFQLNQRREICGK